MYQQQTVRVVSLDNNRPSTALPTVRIAVKRGSFFRTELWEWQSAWRHIYIKHPCSQHNNVLFSVLFAFYGHLHPQSNVSPLIPIKQSSLPPAENLSLYIYWQYNRVSVSLSSAVEHTVWCTAVHSAQWDVTWGVLGTRVLWWGSSVYRLNLQ